MADLTNRQAVEISHAQFRSDSLRLVEGLARVVQQSRSDPFAPAARETKLNPGGQLEERTTSPFGAWSATVAGTGILGFEASGVVDSVGPEVHDVAVGDEVAVFLPGSLGGYAERVNADFWVRKPANVPWTAAAALPASGDAAVRVLKLLGLAEGETLLVLGGNGSVGSIATQLAVARGAEVISAVRPSDFTAVAERGAVPIDYHQPLSDSVPAPVDAVLDASGRSNLQEAVALAGGPARVVTLSDPRAGQLGVALSGPVPAGIPAALREAMDGLAAGTLSLPEPTVVPLDQAADVHAGLESGTLRGKVLLQL